jgi:predicted dehydrogenase/threonine dehydrogenase-like Zn-dependent dehydrogenase
MHLLITRTGKPEIIEAPDPVPDSHEVLIETGFSALSTGTETQAIQDQVLTPSNLVRRSVKAFDKIRRHVAQKGIVRTVLFANEKVRESLPLGYSVSGRVLLVGARVPSPAIGDYVMACGPSANHASLVCVPHTMCAALPSDKLAMEGSVAALACVGIHALHRSGIEPDSRVVVLGLGIIGQFTAQALKAAGCEVVAFDPMETRRNAIETLNIKALDPGGCDFGEAAQELSPDGEGFHAVFVCAKSQDPQILVDAARLLRRRGRIVIVGDVPIHLPREALYHKELEIILSAAYGEGRHDPAYERFGEDYPPSPARWTVKKNLELLGRWLLERKIRIDYLQPEQVKFNQAPQAYNTPSSTLLKILEYTPETKREKTRTSVLHTGFHSRAGTSAFPVGVLGSGNFALGTHLPNLYAATDKFRIHSLSSRNPVRLTQAARRFAIPKITCDPREIFQDGEVEGVFIITPHSTHARFALEALENGKHVFVEKPLALNHDELSLIRKAVNPQNKTLFVGFNRRWAPATQAIQDSLQERAHPLKIEYEFHALPIPNNPWLERDEEGGRFLGEVCHAVDWILWMTPGTCTKAVVSCQETPAEGCDIQFEFDDASLAHLKYRKPRRHIGPKESITIHYGPSVWKMRDFLELEKIHPGATRARHYQSKGHAEILDAFYSALSTGIQPGNMDPERFLAHSSIILDLDEAFRMGGRVIDLSC